jgi:hypothetical protein
MGEKISFSGPSSLRPRIVSPIPGADIVIDDERKSLPLKSEGAVGLVHWYLDDRYLETADHWATVIVDPGPGRHRLSLMDSRNMTAKSEFTVIEKRDLKREINNGPNGGQWEVKAPEADLARTKGAVPLLRFE